ncbi:hypothetical protein GALL_137610 [mine drainage metagenome]|uniref:Uncharacterized protein n=1 Tax=mine drainage metagenome TaxID=410659 RepID=A0A1J5S7J8_9ZZZZ
MKKTLHTLAIMLFALTQLCAPLVHAHVDGMQSDSSFHVHEIPRDLPFVGVAQCHIEQYESQAITIPDQNQHNDALVVPDFCTSSTHPLVVGLTLISIGPFAAFSSAPLSYHIPHTQAPPEPS